jgi:hypothetical protein
MVGTGLEASLQKGVAYVKVTTGFGFGVTVEELLPGVGSL